MEKLCTKFLYYNYLELLQIFNFFAIWPVLSKAGMYLLCTCEFYVPFMTLQSFGFKFFAKINTLNTTIYIRSNFYSSFKYYEMFRLKMNIKKFHPKSASYLTLKKRLMLLHLCPRGTESPFVLEWSVSCQTISLQKRALMSEFFSYIL